MLKALVVDGVKAASVCEASFELPSAVLLFEPLAVPVCVVSTRGSAFVVVSGLELGKDSPAPDAFPVAFELAVAAWLLFPLLLSDEAAGSEELAPLLLAGSAVKAWCRHLWSCDSRGSLQRFRRIVKPTIPTSARRPCGINIEDLCEIASDVRQSSALLLSGIIVLRTVRPIPLQEFDAYSFAYDM
ncbi:hypothetical protein KC320_g11 [Hortaea werneckii]|nr:hypothetical protein KC320_g11 [Hortaea werneckii]